MVSGLQFSFLQFNYINSHVLLIEYLEFSSVVECAFSGGFTPSSNSKRFSFCWIGFWARDYFKHSEVKWRQLPWLVLWESMTTCRPYSVQEWNARIVNYSSVLLQYFVALFRPCDGPLTWCSDPTTHRFAKSNGFRELFSNTQCLVCFSDAFWKSVLTCHV